MKVLQLLIQCFSLGRSFPLFREEWDKTIHFFWQLHYVFSFLLDFFIQYILLTIIPSPTRVSTFDRTNPSSFHKNCMVCDGQNKQSPSSLKSSCPKLILWFQVPCWYVPWKKLKPVSRLFPVKEMTGPLFCFCRSKHIALLFKEHSFNSLFSSLSFPRMACLQRTICMFLMVILQIEGTILWKS